jgi:hypothetical protein
VVAFILPEKDAVFGVKSREDLKWMKARLTPHPMATFEQTLSLSRQEALALPRSFIWCSMFDGKEMTERPSIPADWKMVEMKTGHDAMITEPEQLMRVLVNLANADHV